MGERRDRTGFGGNVGIRLGEWTWQSYAGRPRGLQRQWVIEATSIEALKTKANLEDEIAAKHLQFWLAIRLVFVCRGVCEDYIYPGPSCTKIR